ncbi:hypothetical protein EVA_04681 [gut metagenome]|uniref:Uncharacterized protein n=1 Tax=gut metagenome TaxID=749906 RepID=J9H1D4_9ZZZZ
MLEGFGVVKEECIGKYALPDWHVRHAHLSFPLAAPMQFIVDTLRKDKIQQTLESSLYFILRNVALGGELFGQALRLLEGRDMKSLCQPSGIFETQEGSGLAVAVRTSYSQWTLRPE